MKIYFIQFGFEEVLPIPFMKRVKKIIDDEDMENMIIGSSLIGDYSIMCAKQHKIDKFIEIGKEFDLIKSYKDITEDLVMDNPINDLVDSLKGDEILDSLLSKVLTVDMVLDKISLKGIDSLTEIDKEALKI